MLIQYLLVFAAVLLLVFFLRNHGSALGSASVKAGFLLFLGFGAIAVIRPGDVTAVARFLDVGRGTDLLLYGLVVAFGFASINTYLRFKVLEVRYAKLVRSIALLSAEPPRQNGTPEGNGNGQPVGNGQGGSNGNPVGNGHGEREANRTLAQQRLRK